MVSYMWGKDVADALLGKQCLPADPNDPYDFDVGADSIERAMRDHLDRWETWPMVARQIDSAQAVR